MPQEQGRTVRCDKARLAIPPPHPIDAPAKTSSGSSDQREDVSGPGCPHTSGCGRLTGEVWAGKILSPLDAENGFRTARSGGGGQRAVGALLNP
jgi:hypothetical protein